jgi:hypothetical protein
LKPATAKEIRDTIKKADREQLEEICLRLARFKNENKELITYMLFEADDEASYIIHVKEYLDEMFGEVNKSNLYYAKKNIRKILRHANKFIRYSGKDETEMEILLYLAAGIRDLGLDLQKSQVLMNLYNGIMKKADKKINSLHEDLQYDFRREYDALMK